MAMVPREKVYFADREIWISDRRILVAELYYPLKGIRKVAVRAVDYRGTPKRSIMLGCLFIVGILFIMRSPSATGSTFMDSYFSLNSVSDFVFWGLVLGAIALMVVGLLFLPEGPRGLVYFVKIYRRFKSTTVFVSVDRVRADSIARELREAISRVKAERGMKDEAEEEVVTLYPSKDTRRSGRPAVIVGDLLAAGNRAYGLGEEVQSVDMRAVVIDQFSGFVPFLAILIFSRISLFREEQLGWISTVLSCVGFIFWMTVSIWLLSGLHSWQPPMLHRVSVTGTFGKVIAFASMDKAEATAVQDEILLAIGRRVVLMHSQPSGAG
jgi:hypothetical protein